MAYSDFNEDYRNRTSGLAAWLQSLAAPSTPTPPAGPVAGPVDFGSQNPTDKAIGLAQEAFQPGSVDIQPSHAAQPPEQPFRDSTFGQIIGGMMPNTVGRVFDAQRGKALADYAQNLPTDPLEAIQGMMKINPQAAQQYIPELMAAAAKEPELKRQKDIQAYIKSLSDQGGLTPPGAAPPAAAAPGSVDFGAPSPEFSAQPAPAAGPMSPMAGFKDPAPAPAPASGGFTPIPGGMSRAPLFQPPAASPLQSFATAQPQDPNEPDGGWWSNGIHLKSPSVTYPNQYVDDSGDKYPAQTQKESGGDPNAVSPKGAYGLKQLMPATAANPGFGIEPVKDGSVAENMRVGNEYMDAMLTKYKGNVPLALAGYNWGPGVTDKWISEGADPAKLPPETAKYIKDLTPAITAQLAGKTAPAAGATPLAAFNQHLTPEEGMALKMASLDPKYADNALAAFGKRAQNTPYTAAAKAQADLQHGLITQPQYDEMEKAGLFKTGDSNLPSSIQEANAYEAAKKLGTPEGNQRAADIAMFAKTSGVADPAVLAQAVDAVGQNDVNSATLFSRGSLADKAAIIAAVRQKYPNWNQRQFDAIADFNNGAHGDQVKFTSNVTEHLELSRELFNALQNGNTPLFNKVAQAWAQQTGSEVPTDFQSAVNIVGQEMVKSIVPSGGTAGDREEAQKAFDIAKSQGQGTGAIDTIEKLMRTQIRGNERQFMNSTGGTRKDFLKLISPQAAAVLYPDEKGAQDASAAPAPDLSALQAAAAAELAKRGG